MMQRRHLIAVLAGLPVSLHAQGEAELVLVVGVGSGLQSLTRGQAVGYFTGRLRSLPNGELAVPLDLPSGHPVRERFYRLLTGLGPPQMNSYWARLAFSGQTQPPQVMDSEAALVRSLRDNPRSIGYLPRAQLDDRLRVLLAVTRAEA